MSQLARLSRTLADGNGKPNPGSTYTVYREGATVSGAQDITSGQSVLVKHIGKIRTGDTVFLVRSGAPSPSTTYAVNSTTGVTQLTLGGFAGTLHLGDGDRIVPLNNPPSLWVDDQGSVPASNPLVASAIGGVDCSLEYSFYDGIAAAGGVMTFEQDMIPDTESPAQIRFADVFAQMPSTRTMGIQEAVDDLPATGGFVFCTGKAHSITATIWLHPGVHLVGAGRIATTIQRAAGSIIDSDPTASAPVICAGPKGSNGTRFTSGSHGSNISVSSLTVDGSSGSFSGLTNAALCLNGIRMEYVDGLNITGVRAQNCLMDGFYISVCTDVQVDRIIAKTIGHWSVVSSRNGISFYFGCQNVTLSNFNIQDVGDPANNYDGEAITVGDIVNASISTGVVDGAFFGIEILGDNRESSDVSFNGITFRNLVWNLITFNSTTQTNRRFKFTNITGTGHATLHDSSVIALGSVGVFDSQFSNISFSNFNTKDVNNHNAIDMQPTQDVQDVDFSTVKISGLSTSVRIGDVGLGLNPGTGRTYSGLKFNGLRMKDIAGAAFSVNTATTGVLKDIQFNSCSVDGCNYYGFFVRNQVTASTITELSFNQCVAKDCAKVSGVSGFYIAMQIASGNLTNVYLRGCRSYRTTSAGHAYGIYLHQTAGTLGPVYLEDCDFTGCVTGEILKDGTVTGLNCVGRKSGAGQELLGAGSTITLPSQVKDCFIPLAAAGSQTLTSTPTLPDGGFDGQRAFILNVDSGGDTITVKDQGTLAGTNLRLSAATVTLGPRDSLQLVWSDSIGDWVQSGTQDVI